MKTNENISVESLLNFLNSKTVSKENMSALMNSYKKNHYIRPPKKLNTLIRNQTS